MSKVRKQDSFWTSYADLMTSLFFVMLVLFVICMIYVGKANKKLGEQLSEAEDKNARYENILQLQEQFKVLSHSTSLAYDDEKKMFYAKDFVGIEIFLPDSDAIKSEYLELVDSVGSSLQHILMDLNSKKMFNYQLVIEGTAAIPYSKKINNTYNPDATYPYELSYRRALALYRRWQKYHLRDYNTEIIISGSGFNGINRDQEKEDNNKRFVIQIIPKVQRPSDLENTSL